MRRAIAELEVSRPRGSHLLRLCVPRLQTDFGVVSVEWAPRPAPDGDVQLLEAVAAWKEPRLTGSRRLRGRTQAQEHLIVGEREGCHPAIRPIRAPSLRYRVEDASPAGIIAGLNEQIVD